MAPASLLLAFLAEDVLALIAHALALVGLGGARGADFGCELADLLLVDARHGHQLLLGPTHNHLHARRHLVQHVVAEAHLQLQCVLALHRRTEADAVDLERLRIALGDPFDQVHDLRARHAQHGAGGLGVLGQLHLHALRSLGDLDLLGTREAELAFRPLHRHLLASYRRRHARRDRYRLFAYPRHRSVPRLTSSALRTRCRGFRRRRSPRVRANPTSRPWVSTGWRRPARW